MRKANTVKTWDRTGGLGTGPGKEGLAGREASWGEASWKEGLAGRGAGWEEGLVGRRGWLGGGALVVRFDAGDVGDVGEGDVADDAAVVEGVESAAGPFARFEIAEEADQVARGANAEPDG